MEKYMSNLRLILIGESVNNLIGPIKSRCFMIRVPRPQPEEIAAVLNDVAKAEELELPGELTEKIVSQSQRDLRKALLVLQALSSQK
jgi:replication factor C subunit 3/5